MPSSNNNTQDSMYASRSADTSAFHGGKNVAIIGKPGAGKTLFIAHLKEIPISPNPKYFRTVGFEVHPMERDIRVWEFGHYTDPYFLKEMHTIIQIGKSPQDSLPDGVPVIRVPRGSQKSTADAYAILNQIA